MQNSKPLQENANAKYIWRFHWKLFPVESLYYLNANFPNHSSSHVHIKKRVQIHGNYHVKSSIRMSMTVTMMATNHTEIMAMLRLCKSFILRQSSGKLCNRRENNNQLKRKHNRIEWTNRVRRVRWVKTHTQLQLSKCHLTSSNFKNGLPPTVAENTNELQNIQTHKRKRKQKSKNAYASAISFSFARIQRIWVCTQYEHVCVHACVRIFANISFLFSVLSRPRYSSFFLRHRNRFFVIPSRFTIKSK